MAQQTARILREAKAGLDDRSDVLVYLSPGEAGSGIRLEVQSTLMSLFGDQIRASVLEVIEGYGLTDLKICVNDRGALDYAIRARVQAAIERASKEGES